MRRPDCRPRNHAVDSGRSCGLSVGLPKQLARRILVLWRVAIGGTSFQGSQQVRVIIILNLLSTLVAASFGRAEDKPFGSATWLKGSLQGELYELQPNTTKLPDFQSLKPIGRLYVRQLDVSPRNWQEGFPGVSNRFEWFALEYTARIRASRPGTYSLRLLSDDGAKLFIDDKLMIDNDGIHSARSMSGAVDFDNREHIIRVQYFQGPRDQLALQLFCVPPGGQERLFPDCDLALGTPALSADYLRKILEGIMDSTTLVITFGFLAFMVERLTNGIAIMLGYWPWWRLHMEPSSLADEVTRLQTDRNRRVGLFALSVVFSVIAALLANLNLLAGIPAFEHISPIAGSIISGLMIAAGADPIREFLKIGDKRDESRESRQQSPVQVTGTLILQQAASTTKEKKGE
jgi:hypothetical protein